MGTWVEVLKLLPGSGICINKGLAMYQAARRTEIQVQAAANSQNEKSDCPKVELYLQKQMEGDAL